MGNTCQNISQKNSDEYWKRKHSKATGKTPGKNEINHVKYDSANQPDLSPLHSDISSFFDERTEYSLHGIGIKKNPFYLSPANSMSSSSTMSSYQRETLTESSIRKTSLLSRALGQPMLPPMEESYEEDEAESVISKSKITPQPQRLSQLSGERQNANSATTRMDINEQRNDEYLEELMREIEDTERDANLDETPNQKNIMKNFQSVLNKKVQDKMPRSGQNFHFPTPPQLRLPSAIKKKSLGSSYEDIAFISNNDADNVSSHLVSEAGTPQNTTQELNEKMQLLDLSPLLPLPSPAEEDDKMNDLNQGDGSAKNRNDDRNNEQNSVVSAQSNGKNPFVKNEEADSVCYTEASSFDFFDQIMADEVPESTQRSFRKVEKVDSNPEDLQLLFEEVEDDEKYDESLDLLSKTNETLQDQEVSSSIKNQTVQELQSDIKSPNDLNKSNMSAYEKIHDERGPFTRLYSFSKLQQISMQPEQNINGKENHIEKKMVGEIKDSLWRVKKALTPKSPNTTYDFKDSNISKDSDAKKVAPIVKKKYKASPRQATLLRSLPSNKSFRAAKKAMSPKKHSYRRPFLRKQNSSSRMVLAAETAANNVKTRISELNVKLMRTKDIRKNIIGSSKVLSPRMLNSNEGIIVKPMNYNFGVTNAIRRDKGAAIVKKTEGVWANYSLDSAGPVWKRKEENDEIVEVAQPKRQGIIGKSRKSTGHWTNYSLDGAGPLWKRKDDEVEEEGVKVDLKKVSTIQEESINLKPSGIATKNARSPFDDTTDFARKSTTGPLDIKKIDNTGQLIEYLGEHPCLSDMSPLTTTSSEVFRGRNGKINDIRKAKSIELDSQATEQSATLNQINNIKEEETVLDLHDEDSNDRLLETTESVTKETLASTGLDQDEGELEEIDYFSEASTANELDEIDYLLKDDNLSFSSSENDYSTDEGQSKKEEMSVIHQYEPSEALENFTKTSFSKSETSDSTSLYEIEESVSPSIMTPISDSILDSNTTVEGPCSIVSNKNSNINENDNVDKENQPVEDMKLSSVANAKVNPHQQNRHKGPPSGLCLSPVQRTPMQARKWRDLAAAAAAKDKSASGKKKKTGMKTNKMRRAMGNILNDVNV